MIFQKEKAKGFRGFTLIELLVVIAIIGILSAVILASLNTARKKGADARIESDLNSIQTQAAIDYDSNGQSYVSGTAMSAISHAAYPSGTGTGGNSGVGIYSATAANEDQQVSNLMTQIQADANGAANTTYMVTATQFAYEAQLTAPTTATYFCVDSTGKSEQTTTVISTAACP